MTATTLLWLRNDLRLQDNPALHSCGGQVLPVYILDETNLRRRGGASRWWLHHSLAALQKQLAACGSRLLLQQGDARVILPELARTLGITRVVWNRCYDAGSIKRDQAIKASLKANGVTVESYNASLLLEPWELETKTGKPYQVFTPFWQAVKNQLTPAKPLPAPTQLITPREPAGLRLEELKLLPTKPDWAGGLRATWQVGSVGAQQRWDDFLHHGLLGYKVARNLPALPHGTSKLSPHLHFGEISVRQLWHDVLLWQQAEPQGQQDATHFLSELGWREFSYYLLYHWPTLPEKNFRPSFDAFPWQPNETHLRDWQQGRIGVPIVDAGMRELYTTGWMHNRVRMIAASWLVKDCLIPWQQGEAWFWDTLVDADPASNAASWQWVAGSGADAAPYFRIFNPVLQGEKFDPSGAYVRRWVPEIADLPNSLIHQPWRAPQPSKDYPPPRIDHHTARDKALAAFKTLKVTAP